MRINSKHYNDVIMGAIASQSTSLTIAYSTIYSDADQRKHQSSASLAFVQGIHRGPVNSTHKWPAKRKMSPFDDVIMITTNKNTDSPHNAFVRGNKCIPYTADYQCVKHALNIMTCHDDILLNKLPVPFKCQRFFIPLKGSD